MCTLTDRQVRLAQILGMDPGRLVTRRATPSRPWKRPTGEYIEQLFEERFGEPEWWQQALEEEARPWPVDERRDPPPLTRDQLDALRDYAQHLILALDDWLACSVLPTRLVETLGAELLEAGRRLREGRPLASFTTLEAPTEPDLGELDEASAALEQLRDQVPAAVEAWLSSRARRASLEE